MKAQRVPLTRRQHEIVGFFQEFQRREGISPTLEEIAQHLGVNKVTVFGHVAELEKKGVLRRGAKNASRSLTIIEAKPARTTTQLPILGTVAAGSPITTLEGDDSIDLAGWLSTSKDLYGLRVRGNSMVDDGIREGDIVLVERTSEAKDGDTVVAVLPGEQATLKRFQREGKRLRLKPANSGLTSVVVDSAEVRGVVRGLLRTTL